MKVFSFFYFIAGALSVDVAAQSLPLQCGNDLFSGIIREYYPDLDHAIHSTFESAVSSPDSRSQDLLTVNVVVHVVWKEDAENLHDSIILDQLRVLNEDFNRLNTDAGNLRSRFKAEAGSADIRFELAEIIRVHTDRLFDIDLLGSNLLAEVKYTTMGGSDARNTDHFINIWVCKIQPVSIFGVEVAQILGFAFPPNNLTHWPENVGAPTPEEDGVVIDYRVFGSNNPNVIKIPGAADNLVIKGRTPVHEVGHYLGLRHIWGDGGILGPNDCEQSDGIDDTPFANAQSPFNCDTTRNTCTHVESHYSEDVPDLIENFMDYASEECMNMFTHGQVTLMRNILMGPRNGLIMPFTSALPQQLPSGCRLLPNPASGPLVLELELNKPSQIFVRFIDINGQIRHEASPGRYDSGTNRIHLDHLRLTPGMYFVEIRNETAVRVEKLLIN